MLNAHESGEDEEQDGRGEDVHRLESAPEEADSRRCIKKLKSKRGLGALSW